MLLQYRPIGSNGDNRAFGTRAEECQYEDDYPHCADKSKWEARWVLAAKMFVRYIPHFPKGELQAVLTVNIFKYMAFLRMQESIRGDWRWEEKEQNQMWVAGNYQVRKDYNPDDPSQPISAITCTAPGQDYPKFDMISKGATQARNMLEDPCIQMAMEVCAPTFDPVIIVEAAL